MGTPAGVVVWEEGDGHVCEMLARVRAKGIPLIILGAPIRPKVRVVDVVEPSRRGLPA